VVVMIAVAGLWFALEVYLPVHFELASAKERLVEADEKLENGRSRADTLAAQIAAAAAERAALEHEITRLGAEQAERQRQVGALAAVEATLRERLADRIASGDVAVKVDPAGPRLVVTLGNRVLFGDPVTIGDSGKALLGEVGGAVRSLGPIEVGAHYEPWVPTSLRAQFATPWELSAARAVAVTRFLSESAKIPGGSLSARAYGSALASASRSSAARETNRRVELSIGAP
jgi:chemotaxis protein MotB